METASCCLHKAKDDLRLLEGKKIELTREQERLTTHRQVFAAELERLDGELATVKSKLGKIDAQHRQASWQVARLRLTLFLQIAWRCCCQLYSLLAFLLVSLLQVVYVTLSASACVARTILETQRDVSGAHDPTAWCTKQ